jgi:glycosyltransferase
VKKNDPNHVTRVWHSSPYKPGAYQTGWQPAHPTFFVRRAVYEKYGLFKPELAISADYELMLRFLERYRVPSVYIPATLAKMREGGNSNWKNLSRVWAGNKEVVKSWKMNGIPMPWYMIPLKLVKKFWQTVNIPRS